MPARSSFAAILSLARSVLSAILSVALSVLSATLSVVLSVLSTTLSLVLLVVSTTLSLAFLVVSTTLSFSSTAFSLVLSTPRSTLSPTDSFFSTAGGGVVVVVCAITGATLQAAPSATASANVVIVFMGIGPPAGGILQIRHQRSTYATGCTSVDALGLARPLFVAQNELLDLAGGRLGQIAELHGRGRLEVGDVLLAEIDDFSFCRPCTRLQGHEGLGPLAPLLVGHGHHRALHDGGMAGHALLDLDGRNVLAARDDDVLLAVAQLDVAVGMPHGDVAGVEPPAPEGLRRRVRLLEVPLHHVVAAHDHLAQR